MLPKHNMLIEFAVKHNEDSLTGNNDETRAAPRTPQMKRFGLIGDPIAHSLSPALFRAGYGTGEYTYDLIEGADFESSYRKFLDKYDGINVTAPFKELAFAKADIRSPECRKIGATNLLVKTPEGIKAYNSDYYGIILSLLTAMEPGKDTEQLLSILNSNGTTLQKTGKSMKALVVGCGGAGKAAAVAAGDLGFTVTLMNRTPDKAEAIAKALPEYGFSVRPTRDFKDCFTEADLIIYTLPCPLKELDDMLRENGIEKTAAAPGRPHQTTSPTGCAKAMRMESRRKLILEANYKNPSLANMVLKPGCAECPSFPIPAAEYISGKRWLLYQAYTGYNLFTGQTPDLHAMEKAMKF